MTYLVSSLRQWTIAWFAVGLLLFFLHCPLFREGCGRQLGYTKQMCFFYVCATVGLIDNSASLLNGQLKKLPSRKV